MDAHASGLRASSALRQIRRGPRRSGLPERDVDTALHHPDPFDVVDVGRITRMLKLATKPQPVDAGGKGKLVQLTLPRFARSEEHFQTRPGSTSKKKEGV